MVHVGLIGAGNISDTHARAAAEIPDVHIAAVYGPTRDRAGRLGSPILATAHVKWYRPPSYYADSRWRGTRRFDGGGALMNQGIHTVDLLLWLFGPVRRVFARTAALLHKIEVEDTAVAVLE